MWVPVIGREALVPARPDGSADAPAVEAKVGDLVELWNGWPQDSFDVQIGEGQARK